MKTISIKVFRFEELSKKVRKKVIADERDNREFYSDSVTEDYTKILEYLGFRDIKIHYHGFYSQGDGASFQAKWKKIYTMPLSLKEHAPEDKNLHNISDAIEALTIQEAEITQSGHYCHENTMNISSCEDNVDTPVQEVALLALARAAAREIYKALETEYNHQFSDDTIDEELRNSCDPRWYFQDGAIYGGE